MEIYLLYAKGISFTDYTLIGACSSPEKARQAWRNFSSDMHKDGKIENIILDKTPNVCSTKGWILKSPSQTSPAFLHPPEQKSLLGHYFEYSLFPPG